jgi:hypothetical protein
MVSGTWHWIEPGRYYRIQVGAAGKAEYIDSLTTCVSVRMVLSHDTVQTMISLYEVEEQFKFDSTVIARFFATGRPNTIKTANRVNIGSQYSTSTADIFVDGVADEVEINKAILIMSQVQGGGLVHLGPGVFHIAAAIA